MKRIAFCMVLCLLCATFSMCARHQTFSVPENGFSEANFNNRYYFSGDFWAFKDGIFYLKDGFYNMGAYWSVNGETKKLFEESDFSDDSTGHVSISEIFVCDSDLYFECSTEDRSRICRYDLKKHTDSLICEIPDPYRWVIAEDRLICREHPLNNDENRSPLWIYNLTDGTNTQICPHVEEFGIVDGQLRYLTYEDGYRLYAYHDAEGTSSLLGTFSCEFDNPFHVFNFTHDAVVRYGSIQGDWYLFVYSLSSNTSALYPLPQKAQQFAAYDRYAFFVIYDRNDPSDEENGIYRMSLSDGSYELAEKGADDDTKIHVASDDTVYIIQGQLSFLSRHERHVYFLNCTTGDKIKITVL